MLYIWNAVHYIYKAQSNSTKTCKHSVIEIGLCRTGLTSLWWNYRCIEPAKRKLHFHNKQMTNQNKSQLPPLLVGKTKLAKLFGVSKQRVDEILFALQVKPIPGLVGDREMFSYPQIINRLETVNEAPVTRRRAFRQPEMNKFLNNTNE